MNQSEREEGKAAGALTTEIKAPVFSYVSLYVVCGASFMYLCIPALGQHSPVTQRAYDTH